MREFKWRFAESNFSKKQGLNDSGIESFTGARIKSLTREICQNSLDAKIDINEINPVIVEFSEFQLPRSKFPDVENLEKAITKSLYEGIKLNDKKTKQFFEKSLNIIKKEKIPFLRVSDFNTKGLTGVTENGATAWNNLVKSQGISDKGSTDGGSFGIGKNATFACSDLRTVIYSTYNINQEVATQGVSNLISYDIGDEGDHTQGVGYLSNTSKNEALLEATSLDESFKRNVPGTDIFIAGLISNVNVEEQIIVSAIDNFLYAIYIGTLKLKVNDIKISKETLQLVVSRYQHLLERTTIEMYYLLTDKNTYVFNEKLLFEKDELEIRLLLSENGSRRVSMIRKPWMKIKEVVGFPRQYVFSGTAIIKGEKINALLRKAENPQHNDWEQDRIENIRERELLNDVLVRINRVIRNKLEELHEIDAEDYLDLFGASDYIPLNDAGNNKRIQSKVKDLVKDMRLREVTLPPTGKKIEDFEDGSIPLELEGDVEVQTVDDPDASNDESKDKRDTIEEIIKNKGSKVNLKKEDVRVIAKNRHDGTNRLIINSPKAANYYLKLHVLDEQGDSIKNALNIEDATIEEKEIDIERNFLRDILLKEGKNVIEIKVNIKEYISIGVELYEIS